eukprot:scaffold67012_cov18-Tisochrysis_lutea.AAC.5
MAGEGLQMALCCAWAPALYAGVVVPAAHGERVCLAASSVDDPRQMQADHESEELLLEPRAAGVPRALSAAGMLPAQHAVGLPLATRIADLLLLAQHAAGLARPPHAAREPPEMQTADLLLLAQHAAGLAHEVHAAREPLVMPVVT